MLYLGIDVGKRNHVASLMDENAKILFKAFSFSNTTDGASGLLEKLSAYTDKDSVKKDMKTDVKKNRPSPLTA